MNSTQRSRLSLGLLLILVGLGMLAFKFIPGLGEMISIEFTWPLIVVGSGALLLIIGLLVGAPGMAVPACIVAGIGGILYYQNLSSDWGSWGYLWTLIPGFVGVGELLSWLLGARSPRLIRSGLNQVFISVVLFLIFGSLLGGFTLLGSYWPVLIVLAGLILLARALFGRRKAD